MIEYLQDADAHTVLAIGPRFDLEKVLSAAGTLVRVLIGRCLMCFPEEPPAEFCHVHESGTRPYGADSWTEIAEAFRDAKRRSYDVTDFHWIIGTGPIAVHLFLLGLEALHGPGTCCQTSLGNFWEHLNPAPVLLFRMREGAETEIPPSLRSALERLLPNLIGMGLESAEVGYGGLSFCGVHFDPDVFGAGRGSLRICRYLGNDVSTPQEEP